MALRCTQKLLAKLGVDRPGEPPPAKLSAVVPLDPYLTPMLWIAEAVFRGLCPGRLQRLAVAARLRSTPQEGEMVIPGTYQVTYQVPIQLHWTTHEP